MTISVWTVWDNRHLWPQIEPKGFVFLAHAFDAVGGALFENWSGYEIQDADSPALERIPDAEQAYIGGEPHWGYHQHYGPQIRALASFLRPEDPIPQELWHAVATDRSKMFARAQEARFRRDMVIDAMWQRARTGELVFASRPKGGGVEPVVIPPVRWEIDYPWVPFATLGYDSMRGLASADPTDWLFVTANSLNDVLGFERSDLREAMENTPAPADKVAITIGKMPPTAKPNHLKHELAAHEAAMIIREEKVKPAEAFRRVAKEDVTRDPDSITRAIRGAFDLMYYADGTPIKN